MPSEVTQLTIHVVPNAKKSQVVGWDGETLKVKLHAITEKGKANKELIIFLAELFDLPKSTLTLLRGETSRIKHVEIPIPRATLIKIIEDQLP